MESALYGIYALVAFVYVNNSCVNTVRQQLVNVIITTSADNILLPSSEFFTGLVLKRSSIPGYNLLSPELVLSAVSNPPNVAEQAKILRIALKATMEENRAAMFMFA